MALIEVLNDCVEWPYARDRRDGYGVMREGGYFVRAHRIIFEVSFGPIPRGMSVMHMCDNRACVNPAHLRLGTHADNMRDMAKKGRGKTQRKLSEELVRVIRRHKGPVKDLVSVVGCSLSTIYSVRARDTWRNVE